jgi:hypothetical protein
VNKNKLLCHICDSPSIKIIYELNKHYYEDSRKNFKKIIYIDLNKLLNKTTNKDSKKLKQFSKDLKIFTPKNYTELNYFLENNDVVASVSLNKTYKYFRTWYLLKKNNVILFYILNLGLISNKEYFYKKNLFENIKKYFSNLINVKFAFYIYRFLVLINIFPRIDHVFEAAKIHRKYFKNYLGNKIQRFFNIENISLYQNIIPINSRSYDELIDKINIQKEDYIVFLDSGFDHPDRALFDKQATRSEREKYYYMLRLILKKFSKIYKKKIVFCMHPKSDEKKIKRYLKDINVVKFKTREFIIKASIIFFHESSTILDAILIRKKIWGLSSNTMGSFFRKRNELYPNFLKCPLSDMSDLVKMKKDKIDNIVNDYNFNLFDKKILNYLVLSKKVLYKFKHYKTKINHNDKNFVKGRTTIINFIKNKYF